MASYEVVNNVAIITCQNPPVNQLSYRLRVGLFEGLKKGLSSSNVVAIIIIADGRTFIAGADIKEFSNGMAFKLPLSKFIEDLDASTKPVIAAIHGTALGGGFEVALACHYRIGTSRCKVGLPEVLIGLLPGAGGTQRLPRLVGPMIAAEMICSGKHISAKLAKERGILDRVVNIQSNHKLSMERLILRTSAISYALDIANNTPNDFKNKILSNKACNKMDNFFYKTMSSMLSKKARGYLAPQLCLESVRAAQDSKSFNDGLKKERNLFMKLATQHQSRALQHIFFSQRQIAKIPGINSKQLALPIKRVGIIGCGTMGGGILMCFIEHNIPVIVVESSQNYLDRGLNLIKSNWMRQVQKGRLSFIKYEKYISKEMLLPTLNYHDLSDVDIVIEAVFEKLSIKHEVFKKLDSICKAQCILASNTSFLPIEKIAAVTSRPNKVIGCHFFAPANKMQLLENVRFKGGADDITCATVQNMAKLIGKKGVLVRSCPGFVGNRMYTIEGTEAYKLILEGCTPNDIDNVCYNDIGCAMGIMAVSDLSGLDIGYKSRKDNGKLTNKVHYSIADILVEKYGRLGLKTGKGWYDYPGLPRSRKPVESKFVNDLIFKISKEKGIIRRTNISKQEIKERLFYPLINEGFKILEEGIACRPSDIDVVFVFGYGFPPYLGGPMYWADNIIGLKNVYNSLLKYYEKYNEKHFKPSNLLKECVDKKITLSKLWNQRTKQQKSRL